MADQNSLISVPSAKFNSATIKLDGASAIVSAFGIFIDETVGGDGEMPVTGSLMASAMNGVRLLLDSARDDLSAKE